MHVIKFAECFECGQDDCRYDEIDALCPNGHAWDINISNPVGHDIVDGACVICA